jgi:alkylation response protein AidB-like acyl-CoA dehydrogenase
MNPLISDRLVDFLLYEVHAAEELTTLPAFADFSREAFDLLLDSVRRFARGTLFPLYRAMDVEPPRFANGRMRVHPKMGPIYRQMIELGLVETSKLPAMIYTVAAAHLMAANVSAYGYMGLTSGAAHLIEVFGTDELRERFMKPMYEGRWTGTMALTEPQAGSSLGDIQSRATPRGDGSFSITGSKVFISGGDNDFSENVVHLALARIDGAPSGTRGISLFAVPRLRPEGGDLRDNDVQITGAIHKLGARGLPSCFVNFGDRGDCRGWLVGEAHRGLQHMFKMMNEARILVGAGAAGTASAAYHESLEYAKVRTQGRPPAERDASKPPVPIIEHADVRRMLLRQKAIVEGSFSLLVAVGKLADLAASAIDDAERNKAQLLVDLLTPVAKTFPSEKGFESNALAVQIHGGYGYSSEYLVEAWLRDQKLNTLHEGTSGIQSLDLLGRKVIAQGGEAMRAFDALVRETVEKAESAGVKKEWCRALIDAWELVTAATMEMAGLGMRGEIEAMLRHSADYLEMFSIVVVTWQWLAMAAAAERRRSKEAFYEGELRAAQYWITTELPRVAVLAAICRENEDSYARMSPDSF